MRASSCARSSGVARSSPTQSIPVVQPVSQRVQRIIAARSGSQLTPVRMVKPQIGQSMWASIAYQDGPYDAPAGTDRSTLQTVGSQADSQRAC